MREVTKFAEGGYSINLHHLEKFVKSFWIHDIEMKYNLSHVMRKPAFCVYENKRATDRASMPAHPGSCLT